ncbi:MAG TPA: dTMP kinase [Acholeplasmatales bacterium]|nr:dTMP kinase [Bacillota bacterium]OHE40124.1 MAG: dTMP kinase [Tenericutes bacterium GWF2_57_13]HAQ57181.1 dTMP kinase [Acholeplasmatales bacterium]
MTGKFVTFEGTEGSGKTSIIAQIETYFKSKGYPVLSTREPGGIRISEKIRDILLDKNHTEMDPRTEALLFAASRRQHLVEKIAPALAQGMLVLCDRYVDSSLVYQGIARGLGVEEVFTINKFAIEDAMPDLTIFIDVTPDVGLARVFKNKNREVNRLDLEQRDFYKMIYDGYQRLMRAYPDRIVGIAGERPITDVATDAIRLIEKTLAEK